MTSYDEQLAAVEGKSVQDTLAAVGEDRELARLVLEREQARGEDARSTLTGPLEALLAGPEVAELDEPLPRGEDAGAEPVGPEVFTIRHS